MWDSWDSWAIAGSPASQNSAMLDRKSTPTSPRYNPESTIGTPNRGTPNRAVPLQYSFLRVTKDSIPQYPDRAPRNALRRTQRFGTRGNTKERYSDPFPRNPPPEICFPQSRPDPSILNVNLIFFNFGKFKILNWAHLGVIVSLGALLSSA
jgi:hypothetical protein